MAALMAIWQGFALLLGLVIGSFLNVCIVRMPEDRSVVTPRSQCAMCGTTIRWHDNIPVVSWLVLRGRCRDCDAPISARYPLIELLTGLVAWLLFRRFVTDPADLTLVTGATWLTYFGFLCLLIVATYVDVRHRIIPDQTSSLAVPFALGAVALLGYLGADDALVPTVRSAVAGAVVWSSFFGLTAVIAGRMAGTDALGWGDVKLIALIGMFLGAMPGTFAVILIASVLGSITGITATLVQRRRVMLPFGPALAAASAIYVFYGDLLIAAFTTSSRF